MPRFYFPASYAPGLLELPEPVAHHAVRVCRLDVGDRLTLFDGNGFEADGKIVQTGKTCVIEIDIIEARCRESPLDITLIQALPSMDRMDLVVQKSVELGVSRIRPVMTRRSVRLTEDRAVKKTRHWQQIAIAACEQSGRTSVPSVSSTCSLDSLLLESDWRESPNRWLLCPTAPSILADPKRDSTPVSALSLIVGCEGGFEPDEVSAMIGSGVIPVRLGPRILRTETAGPAAIAICQADFGDFR